jgi:hypothetical protein
VRRTAAVKGGISGVSEPLTARTAAQNVTGEKGAAELAYLAARFAEGGGAALGGGVDQSGAVINVTLHADCVRRRFPRTQCDADAGPRR